MVLERKQKRGLDNSPKLHGMFSDSYNNEVKKKEGQAQKMDALQRDGRSI